jgi:hypothetical protein
MEPRGPYKEYEKDKTKRVPPSTLTSQRKKLEKKTAILAEAEIELTSSIDPNHVENMEIPFENNSEPIIEVMQANNEPIRSNFKTWQV